MGDIGGLDVLKQWVKDRKDCFTDEAKDFGIDTPKGIFLAGAAGTGKSASAKAVAGEMGLPLIRFDISAVFNSLVGSSEARVRSALAAVASMAPCVRGDTLISLGGGETATAEELYLGKAVDKDIPTISETGEHVTTHAHGILQKRLADDRYMLTILDEDDNSISVTDNHKLLILDDSGKTRWREAKDLRVGDSLVRG